MQKRTTPLRMLAGLLFRIRNRRTAAMNGFG